MTNWSNLYDSKKGIMNYHWLMEQGVRKPGFRHILSWSYDLGYRHSSTCKDSQPMDWAKLQLSWTLLSSIDLLCHQTLLSNHSETETPHIANFLFKTLTNHPINQKPDKNLHFHSTVVPNKWHVFQPLLWFIDLCGPRNHSKEVS